MLHQVVQRGAPAAAPVLPPAAMQPRVGARQRARDPQLEKWYNAGTQVTLEEERTLAIATLEKEKEEDQPLPAVDSTASARRRSKRRSKSSGAAVANDGEGPLSQLARRAQSGERPALEQFALATRRYVKLAIRTRMTKELRRELEADELANAAWLSIQHNLNRLAVRGERSLIGWLRRVALTRVLDAMKLLRRKSRHERRVEPIDQLVDLPDARVPAALHANDDPAGRFWERVDVEEVVAALERLPPDLAEILWRIDFEQISIEEVARGASISVRLARRRHAMARMRLASLLRPR
jgi:RNA polymerase sigma factor (sigma-70 family)